MISRYICDVLEEMRQCYKTCNFSPLNGLIEEAQTLANRMEAGLTAQKNYLEWKKKAKKEKKELKKLLKKTNKLRKKAGEPKKEIYGV